MSHTEMSVAMDDMDDNVYVDKETDALYLVKAISEGAGIDYNLLRIFQYEIDKHVYYYGKHHRYPYEGAHDGEDIPGVFSTYLNLLVEVVEVFDRNPRWKGELAAGHPNNEVLCHAYFSWANHLRGQGIQAVEPVWISAGRGSNWEVLLNKMCSLVDSISKLHFLVFLNREFLSLLERCLKIIDAYCGLDIFSALLVPYTVTPFDRFAVETFQKYRKPTVMTLHSDIGNFPCWVNQMETPVDYYQVFGPHQKYMITQGGIEQERIVVTGHPLYPNYELKTPRFGLENILVITRSSGGAPSGRAPLYTHRANMVEFLFRVQRILKEFGVKKVRLRPHPAESPVWYAEHCDPSFFEVEDCPLLEAIERSSLLFGGASTVFLESLIHGVNYVFFEPPEYNGCKYWCNYFASPYDGSEPRVPICKTDQDAIDVLREKRVVDVSYLPERIQREFRPDVFANMIRQITCSSPYMI